MTGLTISLRALKHPFTLASIGLLLINDHVLKAIMPSALTGKLSDFAGLFFFPFLLTAVFSLFLDRWRIPVHRTAALAFGVTLIWFALIKTCSWANAWMIAAVTVLPWPTQIARDPTDLIALVALWPAWQVWIQLERRSFRQPPGKAAYLALSLAALATVATSCPPDSTVTRLGSDGQRIYASISHYETAQSNDGGRAWSGSAAPPEPIAKQMSQPVSLPLVVCAPENAQTCYRITGAEQVEGSQDGSRTWQVIWQVPQGRRRFMEAYLNRPFSPCAKQLSLGPYDLTLLPWNGKHVLVVAIGNEGVLVRASEGEWQRRAVMYATPTPYTAEGMDLSSVAVIVLAEGVASGVVAMVVGWGLSVWGWRKTLLKIPQLRQRRAEWATEPAFWGCIILIMLVALIAASSLMLLLIPLAGLIALVMPFVAWRRVASVSPRPEMAKQAAAICALAALGVFPLAWLPFAMWAYGTIAVYEVALASSVIMALAAVIGGSVGVRRASRRAVQP